MATKNINPRELQELRVGNEVLDVRVDFSQEQLDSLREKLSEAAIQLEDHTDAFNDIKKSWKQTIDEVKTTKKNLIKEIRLRHRIDKRECAMVPDFESGMMEFFDMSTGDMVFSRRLRPEEKQSNIIQAIAANG